MERREFLIQVGKGALAVPLVLIATSCGDDPAAPEQSATAFATTSTPDTTGHTHRVTFECAALAGGTDTYPSTQNSGHAHAVVLQVSEVNDILAGGTVTVESSLGGGHTHFWTITKPTSSCA